MNKSTLIIVLALLIFAIAYVSRADSLKKIVHQKQSPATPTPTIVQSEKVKEYKLDGLTYGIAWFSVEPHSLTFIPNYLEKSTSMDVEKNNECQNLTNAGFYDKAGNPLGLVIANGKTINNYQSNNLFNGIFSITNGAAHISTDIPQNADTAVQSGPIVINDNQLSSLAINNDEPARRTVVAITSAGKLLFLSLFKPDSNYEGPLLTDLPRHLQTIEGLLKISISDALNLDGGSASAFVTDGFTLRELTNVGGFFCAKQ